MITLTINGLDAAVEKGSTILDAAKFLGFPIPTLCHMEGLTPYGACRPCTSIRCSTRTPSGLRKEFGNGDFEKIPTGAIGLYTYYERLAQGLRQLMAGCRKFSLEHLSRDDLAALTPEAAEITGLRFIMDVDQGRAAEILDH